LSSGVKPRLFRD